MTSGSGVPPWEGGCYKNETSYEPWPGWDNHNNNNDDSNDNGNGNRNESGYPPNDNTEGDPPWWTWDTFHQRTSVLTLSADENVYTDDQAHAIDAALNQMSDDPYKILLNTLLDSLRPPDPQDGSMIRLPTPDVVAFLQACSAAGRCTVASVAGDRWTRIVNPADFDDELDLTVDIVDGNNDSGSIGILNLGLQTDCTSTGCDGTDVSVDVDVDVDVHQGITDDASDQTDNSSDLDYPASSFDSDDSPDSDDTSTDSWAEDDTIESPGRVWDLLVNQNSFVMFDMRSVTINGTKIVLPVYIFDPWA
jgi:hypothetical protein